MKIVRRRRALARWSIARVVSDRWASLAKNQLERFETSCQQLTNANEKWNHSFPPKLSGITIILRLSTWLRCRIWQSLTPVSC